MEFARDKLRRNIVHLLDEYEAMLILLGQMNIKIRRHLDSQRVKVDELTKLQLQNAEKELNSLLIKVRRQYGAMLSIGEYTKIVRQSPPVQEGAVLLMPAHFAVAMFQKYPRIADGLKNHQIALHTRVELDVLGQYKQQDRWQFRILEAVLYEDMCFYWNESCKDRLRTGDPYEDKHVFKKEMALYRAAVSSAFYMVEAFCNGIAFEVFLSRRSELTERELQMVTEWDAVHNRPKYLSIRDKLLQYPRLLLRSTSPPLQENNCADLSFFLSSAKQLRDSIVHASPGSSSNTLAADKWQTFERIKREDCAKVIDSAISILDQIAKAIGRRDALFWLQRRQEDGTFNDSVFD